MTSIVGNEVLSEELIATILIEERSQVRQRAMVDRVS